ncbi:uncharacterized protein N7515_003462 [Penicillium bovifimosum]|uniref:Microbial-type PARG catalytic domain-containing protein n=1 Tax=Penicillium bovifimosum TaxID=126998 RepID=A0A9W9L5R9_9EURO|nr:uncharacterized protein N7515_003462 [Penicillium bovifimosum]KAJ5138614.1 hypothetical protein N7515_003462 [Penicillium bovifimosum]
MSEKPPKVSNVNEDYGATPDAIAETMHKKSAPSLDPKDPRFPKLKTVVQVVKGDTFDRAIEMSGKNRGPVCVLNFANAKTAGGGWLKGKSAQEEQLFYRSTLSASLVEKRARLYPMGEMEGIYSPQVFIFRKNVESNYEMMDHFVVVSVVSMAAQYKPPLTDGVYKSEATRDLMRKKMRLILRAAGQMRHRHLALGALGCGAYGHPPREVANCWKTVLQESEFSGWFERIWFIIKDARKPVNFPTFKKILHGLAMPGPDEPPTPGTGASSA